MAWELEEAVAYYRRQGAPGDQSALLSLLKEIQKACDGIPSGLLPSLAEKLGIKESFLLALIRRIPSLRLKDTHCLELCAGLSCGRQKALAAFAEKNCRGRYEIKYVPCMRLCGKGPNIKWDGTLYHRADEDLLRRLTEGEKEK